MKKILKEIRDLAIPIIFVLIIQNFVITHAKVPTGSMIPTINIGDHLVVNSLPTYYRTPERGEVITFKQEGITLIKRVIAVGGDEINLIDGYVYINDQKIDESKYLNKLGITYELNSEMQYPYIIPANCYFVMGDNRGNSSDSRVFGVIKEKDIRTIGALKIYPFNHIEILDWY